MKLGLQFRLLIGDLDSTAVDIIVPQVRDNVVWSCYTLMNRIYHIPSSKISASEKICIETNKVNFDARVQDVGVVECKEASYWMPMLRMNIYSHLDVLHGKDSDLKA